MASALAQEILHRSLVAYRMLRYLVRIATEVFFTRIEISGKDNIPDDGAVIFIGNHPNSLIDPILILAHCGRITHFAAKDVLFRSRLLRPFLKIAGAVPVRRRMDHGGAAVSNAEMFDVMYEVLAAGRATGIFPEGISHDRSQLAPLKTGAARIALGVRRKHPDTRVYIVPTGLVYFDRHRFRSNVLIQFGPPVEIGDDWAERAGQGEDEEREAIRELTTRMDARLRSLTVNADHWNRAWVLDGVRRLYQPVGASLEERARVARRFNLGYPAVKDEPEVRELYRRVESFLMRQSALGVDDAILRSDVGASYVGLTIFGHLFLMAVYTPLFLVGAPIHVPLGLLLKLAGRYFAPRSDVVAATKFITGFLSILLVYAALTALAWWRLGPWGGIATGVLLPSTGWATVRVLGRLDAARHALRSGFHLLAVRKEIDELRLERGLLVGEVVKLVERYRERADRAEADLESEATGEDSRPVPRVRADELEARPADDQEPRSGSEDPP